MLAPQLGQGIKFTFFVNSSFDSTLFSKNSFVSILDSILFYYILFLHKKKEAVLLLFVH